MAVIAVAAIIVNHVIGDLAENNLVRMAEENTTRDAVHMEAMMRRGGAAHAMAFDGATSSDGTMQQPMLLDLETLTGPEGLSRTFPMLAEGLNVVKFNLFDLNGTTMAQQYGAPTREPLA